MSSKILNKFCISKNSISEINEGIIIALPGVQIFDASHNKLVFITPSISHWKSCILNLKLADNKLTELPTEISELANLRKLDISCNLIEELPYTIGNLSKLKSLIMNDNPTLRCIPTNICQLEKLKQIELEWINYTPKQIDCSLEHGQSELNDRLNFNKHSPGYSFDRTSQFKEICREFSSSGKYSITFVEYAGINQDNINYQDSRKRTKISIAAKDNHVSIVSDLIKHGANPNIIDKDKFSALGLAVRENNDTITIHLLS